MTENAHRHWSQASSVPGKLLAAWENLTENFSKQTKYAYSEIFIPLLKNNLSKQLYFDKRLLTSILQKKLHFKNKFEGAEVIA